MRWIRWFLVAIGLALAIAIAVPMALVVWIAEPWSEQQPMKTWVETIRIEAFGDEDREGLAEIFRNWEQGPPFSVLIAAADSSGYGMQFWVPLGYDGEFYGAGAFGQYLWIDARREVVVAQFAAQIPGDVEDRERNAALRALVSAISGS